MALEKNAHQELRAHLEGLVSGLSSHDAGIAGNSSGKGGLGKDFRDMLYVEDAGEGAKTSGDGGRGVDFRKKVGFGKNMKARDFEDLHVVAEAMRFLFRKTERFAACFPK